MQETLLITVKCPECGGSIRHIEGAYTFTCPFCASVLRRQTGGVTLKYTIAPRLNKSEVLEIYKSSIAKNKGKVPEQERVKTIYKPFWYVRGMVYCCHSNGTKNGIEARIWSHTFEANSSIAPSLHSLGLRSEVLDIEGYDSDRFSEEDIVLPVTVDKEEAEKEAVTAAEWGVAEPDWKYHKTNIVGEKLLLIYYPIVAVQYKDRDQAGEKKDRTALFDGVNGTPLGNGPPVTVPEDNRINEEYRLKIVTHRCKNCGHDLESRDFDIVFNCSNCSRLWLLEGDDYKSQKVRLLKTEDNLKTAYIPFWHFGISVKSQAAGLELKTIGDLAEFMRMGRHLLRDEDGGRQLRLYVPAIIARNAKAVLKLAGRIGTFQKNLPDDHKEVLEQNSLLNVSLTSDEAQEMLRPLIFLIIARIDRLAIQFYSDYEVTVTDSELIWYPFEDKGEYFLDRFHNYSFPRRSLDVQLY